MQPPEGDTAPSEKAAQVSETALLEESTIWTYVVFNQLSPV